MIRTQIQLTEEQFKTLKRISNRRHLSVAELIRRGVDVLVHSSGEINAEERKKRAIRAAGRFRSGRKDISTRHDKFLTGAFRS
jgi:hypothetical protein